MDRFVFIVAGLAAALALASAAVIGRAWWRRRRRVRREDALKQICSAKHEGRSLTRAELAGRLGLSQRAVLRLSQDLETAGLLRSHAGILELTEAGERTGMQVLRGHRLWERYLSDEARVPLEGLHAPAERAEHGLKAADLDSLADHLGQPQTDPHGDQIPAADGSIRRQARIALTDWPVGPLAVVVHVEDEPEGVLHKIVRAGLTPGTVLRVVQRGRGAVLYETGARQAAVTPAIAALVHVRPAAAAEALAKPSATLAELALGDGAEVLGLADDCTGLGRRRLLDLGFTSGTRVDAVLSNVGDSTHAYRIRDTLVALRREQAEQVLIRPLGRSAPPGRSQG
jgi:DtxR family Mn-dependent transcriptional regulator